MRMAQLVSTFSKGPRTGVGCIMALREAEVTVAIIDTEGEVLLWTR